MNENEAIEYLQSRYLAVGSRVNPPKEECERHNEIVDMAIKALKEIQQYRKHGITIESAFNNMCDLAAAENLIEEYRAIGTPEECQKSVEICKSMIERNITPENMEEYMKFEDECVKDGFTFNSLLEAREKQTAKKIVRRKAKDEDVESELRDFITRKGMIYRCPTCGCCIAVDEMKSCFECGQKLDWSDEEYE